MSKSAYLILANGDIYEGTMFGKEAEVTGEVVFTTGMTGYLETLTDPSYFGQIIVQTFPLIGNYGIIEEDFESDIIGAKAYIVKHWCQEPSNFRGKGNLDTFFKERGITALSEIDTRSLTKSIRKFGTVNGMITTTLPSDADKSKIIEKISEYRVNKPVDEVSTKEAYVEQCEAEKTNSADKVYKVAMIDYGMKFNIKRELLNRNCTLHVFPHDVTVEQIKELNPDGIMLSNGPGDPEDNVKEIANLKEILDLKIPIFGICLGHQLVALAHGFKTRKLKFGHRGANQPVKDLVEDRVYITSQNHGYEVISESVDADRAYVSFSNVNDSSCEGITYTDKPVFTVQFHPEACGGPKDSAFLFDRFIDLMKKNA